MPAATPSATPLPANAEALAQLRTYVLGLINQDRAKAGLDPVRLGSNTAAQQHAEDMLKNYYLGHRDSGGMKPYMRYSLAGGLGAMAENASYSGPQDPNDRTVYARFDPKTVLAQHEFTMVYDDAPSNWGHRDTILAPQHQFVNIGIAFDERHIAMAQHFEDVYVAFTRAPSLQGGTLSLAGNLLLEAGSVRAVDVYYDPSPSPMSHQQLISQPTSYAIGAINSPAFRLIPPAPPGSSYTDLQPYEVEARQWSASGQTFSIQADVGGRITRPGVYTVLVWSDVVNFPFTSISLFVG